MRERNDKKVTRKRKHIWKSWVPTVESRMVYDTVFWQEIQRLGRFVRTLVNEAFDEHFSESAKLELMSNKQAIEKNGGGFIRRDVDALFRLSETKDEGVVSKTYHFEFETAGERSVIIRIAQYSMAHAATHIFGEDGIAVIEIPYSAVIFLRPESANVTKLEICLHYPGGRVSYDVPVLRIADYTLDSLIEKELYLLIPFHVFTISEREYTEMEEELEGKVKSGDTSGEEGTKSSTPKFHKLEELLHDLEQRLMRLVEDKRLKVNEKAVMMRYTLEVLRKLLDSKPKVKEGVKNMGGYVIETEFEKMFDTIEEQRNTLEEQRSALTEKDNVIAEQESELERLRKEIEGYKQRLQVVE